MIGINYWAVLVCGVLAMILGAIWYGPIFGRKWMEICGATEMDMAKRKEMQRRAMPLYFVQFALVLIQLFILAHLTGGTVKSGILSALLVWAGFVMPTIAACSMWTNEPRKAAWARFLIQSGYQLLCFVVFGIILALWL